MTTETPPPSTDCTTYLSMMSTISINSLFSVYWNWVVKNTIKLFSDAPRILLLRNVAEAVWMVYTMIFDSQAINKLGFIVSRQLWYQFTIPEGWNVVRSGQGPHQELGMECSERRCLIRATRRPLSLILFTSTKKDIPIYSRSWLLSCLPRLSGEPGLWTFPFQKLKIDLRSLIGCSSSNGVTKHTSWVSSSHHMHRSKRHGASSRIDGVEPPFIKWIKCYR